MAATEKLLCLCVLSGLLSLSYGGYNYDYMEEICHGNISHDTRDLNTSMSTYGFVRPVRNGGYPRGMDCTLTLIAPKRHYLVVKFRKLEIYQSSSGCRSADYLEVAGNQTVFTYCGYRTPSHTLLSTTDRIKIRFVSTVPIDNNKRTGFDIYYTAFHKDTCDSSGSMATEFRCRSGGRCIPAELRCDNLDNCGDWSDERSKSCGLSLGMTVCLTVVGVLVGGTCCIALFMCVCAKKKERTARSRREQHPVVQVEYTRGNQPPSYANPETGEKPPLPTYDNTAFTPEYLDPSQFMGPPSYESIAPQATPAPNQVAPAVNLANPTYGAQPQESIPAPAPASNQVAPTSLTTSQEQEATTTAAGAASGNQVAPLSGPKVTTRHTAIGVEEYVHEEYEDVNNPEEKYEDVDLSAPEPRYVDLAEGQSGQTHNEATA